MAAVKGVGKRGKAAAHTTPEFKQSLYDCGYAGMSQSQAIRHIGGSPTLLQNNADLKSVYLTGRDALATEVRKSIVEATKDSYLDRKLIAEKLNIFSDPFRVPPLKQPADARDTISEALQRFTEGSITEQALNSITKCCLAFVEAFSQSVLVKDIAELKAILAERNE